MPAIADITAQNAALANVTFKALVGASGETPALWRAQSVSTFPASQPYVNCGHKRNASRDAQKVTGQIVFPYSVTDTTTGQQKVVAMIPFNFNFTKPDIVPDAAANDAAEYVQSIIASGLFQEILRSGYAPT